MTTLMQIIGLLFSGLFGAANWAAIAGTPIARGYLMVLLRWGYAGIVVPAALVLASLALAWVMTILPTIVWTVFDFPSWVIWGHHWIRPEWLQGTWLSGLWSWFITLAGIMSFGFLGLFLILATPIGSLILAALPSQGNAAQPTGQTPVVTWGTLLSPNWLVQAVRDARQGVSAQLREGVKQYFYYAKIVLAWLGFTCIFLSAFPGMRGMALFLTLCALAIGVSRKFNNVWARLARFGTVLVMIAGVVSQVFPKLLDFRAIFGTAPQELTPDTVKAGTVTVWNFVNAHANQPAFIIFGSLFLVVAVIIAYWVCKGLARTFVATTTTTAAGGDGGAAVATMFKLPEWVKKMGFWSATVALALLLIWLGCLGVQTMIHSAGFGYRAAVATEAAGLFAAARATQVAPTWHGLLNATEHSVELSTNWSRTLPKPMGMKSRWNLWYLPGLQVQANESVELAADRQTTETDIRNLRFRLSGTGGVQMTNMLVAFGY